MHTKQYRPSPGQLQAEILHLDSIIAKLRKCLRGSIMISGTNTLHKDFHELIIFDKSFPLPKDRLKRFLGDYCQDLIAFRVDLIEKLQNSQKPDIAKDVFQDPKIRDNAEFFCGTCAKPTDHHLHQSDMGMHWICDICSNVNPNSEID